jgi:hypothetical protein
MPGAVTKRFEDLKPGDRIYVGYGCPIDGRSGEVRTVTRVSKLQVVDDTGWRWLRSTGREVGGYDMAEVATEHHEREASLRKLQELALLKLAEVRTAILAAKVTDDVYKAIAGVDLGCHP